MSAWERSDDYLPAAPSPSLPLSPGSITNKSPRWERGPEETRGTKPQTEPFLIFFFPCSPKQLCISLGQASPRPAGEKEGGEGAPQGLHVGSRNHNQKAEGRELFVFVAHRGPDPASRNPCWPGITLLCWVSSLPRQLWAPSSHPLTVPSPLSEAPASQRILLGRSPGVFHEP